jgi:hypothetical protein
MINTLDCLRLQTIALGALGLAVTISAPANAAIVTNGNFEATILSSPFFTPIATTLVGWTRTGAIGDAALWAIGYTDSQGNITVAGDGNQFTTMGGGVGATGRTTLLQTVTLSVGQTYQLSFKMASETPAFGQSITAQIVGLGTTSEVFSAAVSSAKYWRNWETKTLNFTADSTTELLSFSANVNQDVGLDAVSIVPVPTPTTVPEPASIALIGAGLLGLGLARRRIT